MLDCGLDVSTLSHFLPLLLVSRFEELDLDLYCDYSCDNLSQILIQYIWHILSKIILTLQ